MKQNKKIILTKQCIQQRWAEMLLFFDGNRPVEFHTNFLDTPSLVGNIYIARVLKVMPQMQAAFLQAGDLKFFCSVKPTDSIRFTKKNKKDAVLCQGDEILVQVVRDAIKTKEITVTTNLAFRGEYVVLTTGDRKNGVSKKLPTEKRKRLKAFLEQINLESYGVIIRTIAKEVSEEVIEQELLQLSDMAERALFGAEHKVAGSLLWSEANPFFSHIKRLSVATPLEIVTDEPIWIERLKKAGIDNMTVRLYEDEQYPLASLYQLKKITGNVLQKKVYLPSGGHLFIEPTETLTVIDVNSGNNVKKKGREDYFWEINREAAEEIVKQLRLRNISGMIVVDFINMTQEKRQKQLLQIMRSASKEDFASVSVLDYTKLGLVEMTREKKYPSIYEQIGKKKDSFNSLDESYNP